MLFKYIIDDIAMFCMKLSQLPTVHTVWLLALFGKNALSAVLLNID